MYIQYTAYGLFNSVSNGFHFISQNNLFPNPLLYFIFGDILFYLLNLIPLQAFTGSLIHKSVVAYTYRVRYFVRTYTTKTAVHVSSRLPFSLFLFRDPNAYQVLCVKYSLRYRPKRPYETLLPLGYDRPSRHEMGPGRIFHSYESFFLFSIMQRIHIFGYIFITLDAHRNDMRDGR